MSTVDIAVVAIILVSLLVGLCRGVIREVLSLLSWIVALWAAYRYAQPGGVYFESYIDQPPLRIVAAFAAIFVMALIAASFLGYLVRRVLSSSGISGIDRSLGMLFGIVRGAIIVAVLILTAIFMDMTTATVVGEIPVGELFHPDHRYAEVADAAGAGDLFPAQRRPRLMCGIIGILAPYAVNQALYDGLTIVQHRGQDAAGIMTSDGNRVYLRKDNGLVRDVFHTRDMLQLKGTMGVGHARYPTAGCDSRAEAQPFYVNSPFGIGLGHNGNLTNAAPLREELFRQDLRQLNTSSDSEILLNIFAHELHAAIGTSSLRAAPEDLFNAVSGVYKRCNGAIFRGRYGGRGRHHGVPRPVRNPPAGVWHHGIRRRMRAHLRLGKRRAGCARLYPGARHQTG